MWGKIMIAMYTYDYTACMDYMDLNVHCPQKGSETYSPVPYHTMLYSEQKCAHFCSEWSIVGCVTGAF